MRDTPRDITVDGNTLKNSEGGGIEMYPHSPGYFYNDASMSVGDLVVLDNEITDSCADAPFSFKIRGVNSSTLLCFAVYMLHEKLQKMSILSIISMLWYSICTSTAPSMKKERRLFT